MTLAWRCALVQATLYQTWSQLPRKGHSSSCLLWPQSPISATAELLFNMAATAIMDFKIFKFLTVGRVKRQEVRTASPCQISSKPVKTSPKYDDFYSAPQCSHCKRCSSYGNSVCLSVRSSVRLSHAGIVSKRRHVARCSLHCRIAKCV